MTTAIGTALTEELARAFAVGGGQRIEIQDLNIVSGDTGATVTAKNLHRVSQALVVGGPITLTAQPTYATNVATLAFTDPVASIFCKVVLIGK